MLTSLAFIFLFGLLAAELFRLMKLPRIFGMMAAGFVMGPHVFDVLDSSILNISSDLRQMALIIILLKAGLALDLDEIKKVGPTAVFMSFIPSGMEILAVILLAPPLLGISVMDAAILGAVLGAASPAIIVPSMERLLKKNYGRKKFIPQLLIAGASGDNVFVIVLFTTFAHMAQAGQAELASFVNVPIAVITGLLIGSLTGYLLSRLFDLTYIYQHYIRNSTKIIIVLGAAFALMALETWAKDFIAISGLLAVLSMASIIRIKSIPFVARRLSEKMGKLWIAAELLLFVLVGATVDIQNTLNAGLAAVLLIFLALLCRSLGVALCLLGSPLTWKERTFCIISYLPKATVQAAIGPIPLAMGLHCGPMVLSIAVLAILITAPLGDMGIRFSYPKLLQQG